MGYAVADGGAYAGIADEYFVGRCRRRVAEIGGVDVGVEHAAKFGQGVDKAVGRLGGAPVEFRKDCVAVSVGKAEPGSNLVDEQVAQLVAC